MPFTREVDLNNDNIFKIRDLINLFSKRLYILMTRESRLSEVLRYYEVGKKYKWISLK